MFFKQLFFILSAFSGKVASRYFFVGKKDRFLAWISILSTAGVGIGVAVVIVVLSVFNGFETQLQTLFLNANAHILAFQYPDGIMDHASWSARMKESAGGEISETSPFVHFETMVENDGRLQTVLVRGFEPSQREKVQSLKPWVSPKDAIFLLDEGALQSRIQSGQLPPAVVGSGVMRILNLEVGQTVAILSPKTQGEFKQFEVVAVYQSGLKHYDNRLVAIPLSLAKGMFGYDNQVTGIEVALHKPFESARVMEKLRKEFHFSFRHWQSFNQDMMESIHVERGVIAMIVFLVSLVAGFNILTTMFISVVRKQKDISVLKSLGARNRDILKIFLIQGAFFGVAGGALGLLLALGVGLFLKYYPIIELPDPYFLTALPVDFDYRVYLAMFFLSLVLCLFFSFLPALFATRVQPTAGIRGQKEW